MSSTNKPSSRAWIALLVGGPTVLASLVGATVVGRDLPAHQTVGLQSRAERHRRSAIDHSQDAVGRCVDAVPIDRRRCSSADEARDRDFYRTMPRKH